MELYKMHTNKYVALEAGDTYKDFGLCSKIKLYRFGGCYKECYVWNGKASYGFDFESYTSHDDTLVFWRHRER